MRTGGRYNAAIEAATRVSVHTRAPPRRLASTSSLVREAPLRRRDSQLVGGVDAVADALGEVRGPGEEVAADRGGHEVQQTGQADGGHVVDRLRSEEHTSELSH